MSLGVSKAVQQIPQVHRSRTLFNLSTVFYTTLSPNVLVPILTLPVQAGDTWSCNYKAFMRFNNLLVPVMSNLKIDTYAFFVRDKDVYQFSDEVLGANKANRRIEGVNYRMPYIFTSLTPWAAGHVSGSTYEYAGPDVTSDTVPAGQPSPVSIQSGTLEAFKTFVTNIFEGGPSSRSPYMIQDGYQYRVPFGLIPNTEVFFEPGLTPPSGTAYPSGMSTSTYLYSSSHTNGYTSDEIRNYVSRNTGLCWHPGGLGHRLYGICGVRNMAVSAIKALGYYWICDTSFRPEPFCAPLFATDYHTEREEVLTPKIVGREYVNYITGHPNVSFYTFPEWLVLNSKYAMCDRWNEFQYGLTQLMCFNGILRTGPYINDPYFQRVVGHHINYKDHLPYIIAVCGGLYPVFKSADYVQSELPEPVEGGDVSAVNTDILSTGNFRLAATVGSYGEPVSPNTLTYVNADSFGDERYFQAHLASAPQYYLHYGSGLTLAETGVEELRERFQMYRFLVRDNRAGHRIEEIMKSHLGLDSLDQENGLPLLLSKSKNYFDVIPNVQTSQTTPESPQGNLTANAVATVSLPSFVKSSNDYGHLHILCAVRTENNVYQEWLDRRDLIFSRFDFPWPEFGVLGDQEVYNYEVFNPMQVRKVDYVYNGANSYYKFPASTFYTGSSSHGFAFTDLSHSIFGNRLETHGYQERYAEWKYPRHRVSGLFDSRANIMFPVTPDPTVPFATSTSLTGATHVRLLGLQNKLGSYDTWHFAYNYDEEDLHFGNNLIPESVGNGLFADLSHSLAKVVQSEVPELNGDFRSSKVPWRRSAYYTDNDPIICKGVLLAKVARIQLANVTPGLADHL